MRLVLVLNLRPPDRMSTHVVDEAALGPRSCGQNARNDAEIMAVSVVDSMP